MGIPGLLRHLKDITRPVQLQELRGLTVGVDANGWLYRGCFTCLGQLLRGVDTDENIRYCMRKVETLLGHGITPLLVFDGAPLPLKADNVGKTRREQRQVSLKKAKAALKVGEDAAADAHYSKAFTVTHNMAHQLIAELVQRGVKYLVAPYEADAQLAYLSHTKQIHAVITEDSDCIVYGCRRVLFKFEGDGGKDSVREIRKRDLAANSFPPLQGWTNSMFLDMCLLAGCDYLPGIHGIGIITAHKLVSRFRGNYRALLAYLRGSGSQFKLPNNYEDNYERARLTYRHHTVFDVYTGRAVPLMPLGRRASERNDLSFLGPILPSASVIGVALSTLHPVTLEPYSNPITVGGLCPGTEGKSPVVTARSPVRNCSETNSKQYKRIQDCVSLELPEKNSVGQGDNHNDLQHYEKDCLSLEADTNKQLNGELLSCEPKCLPFFPPSARNFVSQRVNSTLETLRRKRRRQAGNGDLKQSSQDKEGGGRGVLKWLDDALREESGYDYDGGGEIGTAGYMRLESLERKQTQQEHNPPQGSLVKSGNAPPRQTGEKTQDKEIAYALHSSGNCHEDPLHRNGYQSSHRISSDGRAADPIAPGLHFEKTLGASSYTFDDPSCTYLPSLNSTMEIEDIGPQAPFAGFNAQQEGIRGMNVGPFHPSLTLCHGDGHASTLETIWDERLR